MVEEGLKGIAFAGILALAVTVIAGTPHELFVTPKTQERVEQLSELNKRLGVVTQELNHLSRQNTRLYTRLLHASPQLPSLPPDNASNGRTFYLAGAAPPPIDSSLFAITQVVDRLEEQITRQQHATDQRTEWLEQSPIVLPADGAIASNFGMRQHPIHDEQRLHQGIDISLPGGTPILATGAGMVTVADTADGYGHHVRIHHPVTGHVTLYAHLSQIPAHIEPGQWINRGEVIGLSGNSGLATGPHLHYEIRNAKGRPVNPIDFLLPSRQNQTPRHQHAFVRIDSLLRQTGV